MTDQERMEREEVSRFIKLYPMLLALAVEQDAPVVIDKVRLLPNGDVQELWQGEWIPCEPSYLASLMTHAPIVEEAVRIVRGQMMVN